MQARIGEQEERGTLLRALIGAEGVITPDSLIEVCGLVELMLDPTKAHGERRRYGQPIAAALLRRYETCYGAPRAMFDGRSFYRLERLLAGESGDA